MILQEYIQEFIDSEMKPSRSNCPSAVTRYQDTVIIQYVKGTSEKCRCIGNRFSVKPISKTKYKLPETLMKTKLVRDAQQMKQCVCNIQCECGIQKDTLRNTNMT
jgi:hypothetical protein